MSRSSGTGGYSGRNRVQERVLPGSPERLRVVIADDHPVYRQGLAKTLTRAGIAVVAQASTGEAAIRKVEETAPHIVIMDLNMPGLNGVEATRILADRSPATRVLVLSVSA